MQPGALYAYPREKSIRRFMDQVRALTTRRVPLQTKELIAELNPVLRGWGHHYKRAHVRGLFHQLDGWIVQRIRSHRFKALVEPRVETPSGSQALRRVWACQPPLVNTFTCLS